MTASFRKALILAALAGALSGPARATQICGWLVESVEADDMHKVDLWLQSDQDVNIFYKMAGQGLVTPDGHAHSPGSGTYSLRAGQPAEPWGFGSTLTPPGDIDIIAEVHAPPVDIFSDDPTPLLASFSFQRHIPEGETTPPQTLASKQCVALAEPPPAK